MSLMQNKLGQHTSFHLVLQMTCCRPLKVTHLENLFSIRPAGVMSKKDMGDRKIAVAILSCSFLDAYAGPLATSYLLGLYRAEHKPRWSRISRGPESGLRSRTQSQYQRQSICQYTCLLQGYRRPRYSFRPNSSARYYRLEGAELVQSVETSGWICSRGTSR